MSSKGVKQVKNRKKAKGTICNHDYTELLQVNSVPTVAPQTMRIKVLRMRVFGPALDQTGENACRKVRKYHDLGL